MVQRLPPPAQGRVRIAILTQNIGRIKVAVVPHEAGGAAAVARRIDGEEFDVRGTLLVVSGQSYYALTSYSDSGATVSALSTAVNRHAGDGLEAQLVDAVGRVAAVDPGPDGDIDNSFVDIPDAEGFLDEIADGFRLAGLIAAVLFGLPFVAFAFILLLRYRRSRKRDDEVEHYSEKSVRTELVTLGDEIRSLDMDTNMPDADRAGLAEYEQAIARYDQANDLLLGDPTAFQVEQAYATIQAGRRHIAAARSRL